LQGDRGERRKLEGVIPQIGQLTIVVAPVRTRPALLALILSCLHLDQASLAVSVLTVTAKEKEKEKEKERGRERERDRQRNAMVPPTPQRRCRSLPLAASLLVLLLAALLAPRAAAVKQTKAYVPPEEERNFTVHYWTGVGRKGFVWPEQE
jgi:hypothetical protein